MSVPISKETIMDSLIAEIQAQNITFFGNNSLFENYSNLFQTTPFHDYVTSIPSVQVFFYCLYVIIFVTGICGNVLVCYVVFRNKSMQTVTNIFITNLALSDILLCTFAVTFTPLYIFLRQWIFGSVFCHLLTYVQGVSVYISAITLMSIAIDRFFVIIYPFQPRLKVSWCLMIVVSIWIIAALLTMPYGIFISLIVVRGRPYCEEEWPHETSRRVFGLCTSVLQFVVPFIIISICYLKVCTKLRDRARTKPGNKSLRKEELERERTRKTNRMLIAMVVIFGVSWLPLNVYNLVVDFHIPALSWEYLTLFFVLSHSIAMSSTCYNPFLYAWLNENFRKEFKMVLPCFKVQPTPRKGNSAKNERTCNGHDTVQESLLPRSNSLRREACQQEKAMSVKYVTETDKVKLQIVNNEDEAV
ncbi:prolactin-releasing peptide receptor-like [Limulus polyphemus]|uniref:Prolactin-releasing peptide receptor-like n=1 Tax=Limulus polyphemus TaxID=6850 RepID=A0ABM1TJ72_LIMPO|nr:prolactin-releasing peptide receptor-like [Limulus polyphemus]XP_022255928.1 prolactin-releasing peptide receptor-like [Limulus polyphemus]XP_022255929.1 prolactin-releasing peptide receptor-like [Limulus polyphemus]XP_022255930.1 prolactin-releasing peptide receptor-like [Limulus polyphemus]XP_022255931.1 prolactin-releasing peptide receptor-like [Limulus polyphemus]